LDQSAVHCCQKRPAVDAKETHYRVRPTRRTRRPGSKDLCLEPRVSSGLCLAPRVTSGLGLSHGLGEGTHQNQTVGLSRWWAVLAGVGPPSPLATPVQQPPPLVLQPGAEPLPRCSPWGVVKEGSVDLAHLAHLAHLAQSVDLAQWQPPHRLHWVAGHKSRVLRGDTYGDKGAVRDLDITLDVMLESCGLESFAMPPSA